MTANDNGCTGFTWSCQAFDSPNAADDCFDLTTVNTGVSVDAATGNLIFDVQTVRPTTNVMLRCQFQEDQSAGKACSSRFDYEVCPGVTTMNIDSTNNQPDVFEDFATTAGGWSAATATTEIISFTAACASVLAGLPTCVVTDGACSVGATNWDVTKVRCTVAQTATYTQTTIEWNMDSEYENSNLKVAWEFSGQI